MIVSFVFMLVFVRGEERVKAVKHQLRSYPEGALGSLCADHQGQPNTCLPQGPAPGFWSMDLKRK